jgi:hypothetical protein
LLFFLLCALVLHSHLYLLHITKSETAKKKMKRKRKPRKRVLIRRFRSAFLFCFHVALDVRLSTFCFRCSVFVPFALHKNRKTKNSLKKKTSRKKKAITCLFCSFVTVA